MRNTRSTIGKMIKTGKPEGLLRKRGKRAVHTKQTGYMKRRYMKTMKAKMKSWHNKKGMRPLKKKIKLSNPFQRNKEKTRKERTEMIRKKVMQNPRMKKNVKELQLLLMLQDGEQSRKRHRLRQKEHSYLQRQDKVGLDQVNHSLQQTLIILRIRRNPNAKLVNKSDIGEEMQNVQKYKQDGINYMFQNINRRKLKANRRGYIK